MAKLKVNATRKNATTKFNSVQILMNDNAKMVKLIDFMKKFVLCEVTCKHIIEAYKRHNKPLVKGQYVILDMRVIPAALNLYGYTTISKGALNEVFGGSTKKGKKSAKKLRDGIMHAMNENDVYEIIARETELHRYMDDFLNLF